MSTKRRHRVLILDDEGEMVELIRDSLAALDLDIATASTGAGMIDLISSNFFDTIILDNKMPLMTGLELVHAIRNKRVTTPVIFVSGYLSDLDVSETGQLGAVAFLSKPFSQDILRKTVTQMNQLGSKLAMLEATIAELQGMGALTATAGDSFKHLLLTMLKNPVSEIQK